MKLQMILLAFIIGFTPFVVAQESADPELESIQKLISSTEKLTKNKEIRRQLKRTRVQLDRVRELWVAGAIPDSLGLLFEARRTLYRYGSSESLEFQKNMRLIMKRVWPFLLKTGRFRTEVQTVSGVVQLRMIVPEGTYTMSFPQDAKPGETVSGRLQASPAPSASLYLLTVMGKPVVPDDSLRKWILPESLDLVLIDQWENEIVRANYKLFEAVADSASTRNESGLQEEKQPREAKQNIEIPHLRFEISSKVKSGGYAIIKGPFDGDFSNTTVGVGQYEGRIVTESPGRLILFIHPKMTGEWTVLINEDESWARCRIQVQAEEVDPFATLAICSPPPK